MSEQERSGMDGATIIPTISQDPMRAFSQGDTLGRVLAYCECVRAGCKLVADLLVNRRDIDWVEDLISDEGLLCSVDREHSSDYYHVDVFKNRWVVSLLDSLRERGAPKSFFDHWVNGKLCGYSDSEIYAFLDSAGIAPTRSPSSERASTEPTCPCT
jgi:hypothetical protein